MTQVIQFHIISDDNQGLRTDVKKASFWVGKIIAWSCLLCKNMSLVGVRLLLAFTSQYPVNNKQKRGILLLGDLLRRSWNGFCKEVNKPITSVIFYDVMFGLHPTANRPGNTKVEQFTVCRQWANFSLF